MTISFARRIFAGGLMAGMALTAWTSCTHRPTEIVGGVTTQIQVPKFLKHVGVVVQSGGRLVFCQSYPVVDGSVTLPSTIGAVPPEDAEGTPSEPITVQILGFRSAHPEFENDCIVVPEVGEDDLFVLRRRRTTYVGEKIAYLPLPLRESCSDVVCPEDQTCIGGLCESMDIRADELVRYDDSLIFGDTNTCFDVGLCMPEATLAPALPIQPDDCTFRLLWPDDLPAPQPGHLNVRIVYDSLGVEVLDLDDKEGFVIPDPNDPLTFRLASNMCEGVYKPGRILSVAGAALCPAKRPLQPICSDDLADIQAGNYGIVDIDDNPFCAKKDGVLLPAESALYILMLKQQSMADYFGDDAIAFAIDTPLENPIARRTKVAFSVLPGVCGDPTAFESPLIDFAEVDDVRQPIAAQLADQNLAADTPMNLEPAMEGAYGALRMHQTTPAGGVFNRRALLIIANRDFAGTCGGALPADLASAAFANDGIHTYVAALPLGGTTPQEGAAIAAAGATSFYSGEEDVASGVNEIINDLGSCLYEAPDPSLFGGSSTLPDPSKLSYLDPITQARTDISVNASCNATTQDSADGFNQEADGTIRICGASCQALRDTLTTASGIYALNGLAAPRIPIQISVPCSDDAIQP